MAWPERDPQHFAALAAANHRLHPYSLQPCAEVVEPNYQQKLPEIDEANYRDLGKIPPPECRWQYSEKESFRNFEPWECRLIEHAYKSGMLHMRLKTGHAGSMPSELFFVDLKIFYPITGRCSDIRRINHEGVQYEPLKWRLTQPRPLLAKLKRWTAEVHHAVETGVYERPDFHQYQQRRHETKELQKQDFEGGLYYQHGFFADIHRSSWFFALSMIAVVANAVWIAFETDADTNDSDMNYKLKYRFAKYSFCAIFSVEIGIRLGALKKKAHFIYDRWLCFDAVLVLLMVIEVWIVSLVLLVHGKSEDDSFNLRSLSVLRVLRLLRIVRLGRLADLMCAVPEMTMMVKGIWYAVKSVLFTVVVLVLMLFLFAIMFTTVAKGHADLMLVFPSVRTSMWVLLVSGTFLDNVAGTLEIVRLHSDFLTFIFMVFIIVNSFTILNMLTGLLVDVAGDVATTEKKKSARQYIKSSMLEIFQDYDKDSDGYIHRSDFDVMMRDLDLFDSLSRFGIKVSDLEVLKDMIFEGSYAHSCGQEEGYRIGQSTDKVSFQLLVEVVMRLREGKTASSQDVIDLRNYIDVRLDNLENLLMSSKPEVLYQQILQAAPPSSFQSRSNVSAAGNRYEPVLAQDAIASWLQEMYIAQQSVDVQTTRMHSQIAAKQKRLEKDLQEMHEQLDRIHHLVAPEVTARQPSAPDLELE